MSVYLNKINKNKIISGVFADKEIWNTDHSAHADFYNLHPREIYVYGQVY
jgi:hypothetical protein